MGFFIRDPIKNCLFVSSINLGALKKLRYRRALLENQIKSAISLSDSNALRSVLAKAEHSDLEGRVFVLKILCLAAVKKSLPQPLVENYYDFPLVFDIL